MTAAPTYQYFLQKDNKFLDAADAFTAPAMNHKDAKPFTSEKDALDKAEAMGLDLDRIEVLRAKKKA